MQRSGALCAQWASRVAAPALLPAPFAAFNLSAVSPMLVQQCAAIVSHSEGSCAAQTSSARPSSAVLASSETRHGATAPTAAPSLSSSQGVLATGAAEPVWGRLRSVSGHCSSWAGGGQALCGSYSAQQRQLSTDAGRGDEVDDQQPRPGRIQYEKRKAGDGPASEGELEVQRIRTERRREGGAPEAYMTVRYPVRLHGFSPLALRSDVQRFLSDCDARHENIRVEYDAKLWPKVWWVDLLTPEDQQRALAWHESFMGPRKIMVTRADPRDMKRAILNPLAMGSRGRYVVAEGIQDNANLEDITRHFEGYQLMGNPVTAIRQSKEEVRRQGAATVTRHTPADKQALFRAIVRFQHSEEACRAVRERQGGYLLNLPVKLRVLP